jgi:hydroxymethylbilane synthase
LRHLRLGTRGSDLALWQARFVADALRRAHPDLTVETEVIRTAGDEGGPPTPPPEGVGIFTREIEAALLEERMDIAVHSLKDVPAQLPAGLLLAAILERDDPADGLVAKAACSLADLPAGARVLTGSPRRVAQLLHRRPDLRCLSVRGNVPTRLRKLDESGADALILACAGLSRLGLAGKVTQRLDPCEFIPACGQGALAVEARSDDHESLALCAKVNHQRTQLATLSERVFLRAVGGGCRAPAGAYGRFTGSAGELVLTGMIATLDGSRLVRQTTMAIVREGSAAEQLGHALARALLHAGGEEILRSIAGAEAVE